MNYSSLGMTVKFVLLGIDFKDFRNFALGAGQVDTDLMQGTELKQ
jgi:hypothetical protein